MAPLVLKGVNLNISQEVKYLGVTLDHKLLWGKHVSLKISQALTSFWSCRRVFGKTWGLSPSRVLWIYTAVIRPIIGYAAAVWHSRLSRKCLVKSLTRLQRVVCIGVTGAFPTTSAEALNALLNLPPLDIFLRGEATKSIFRLMSIDQWYGPRDIRNRALPYVEEMYMPSDICVPAVQFDRKFEVYISDRDQWDSPQEPGMGHSRIFTDGSKSDLGSGSGVFVEEDDTKLFYPLGMHATVFQAEIYAILKAMHYIEDMKWKHKNIFVFSDSQAALKALANPCVSSYLVRECKDFINLIGSCNNISLAWVPGHQGIVGNEIADELARKGSNERLLGPEPSFGLSAATVKYRISAWVDSQHKHRWCFTAGSRHTKVFLPNIDKETTRTLLSQPRKDCRILVGILTGHFAFGNHLCRLGLSMDSLCPACLEDEDTALHYLCNCPAFSRIRLQTLNMDVVDTTSISDLPIREILRFSQKCKRFH